MPQKKVGGTFVAIGESFKKVLPTVAFSISQNSIYQFHLQENAFDSPPWTYVYNPLTPKNSWALEAWPASGTHPQPQKLSLFLLQLSQRVPEPRNMRGNWENFMFTNIQGRRSTSNSNTWKKNENEKSKHKATSGGNKWSWTILLLFVPKCKVKFHLKWLYRRPEHRDPKRPSHQRVAKSSARFVVVIIANGAQTSSLPNPTQLFLELFCLLSHIISSLFLCLLRLDREILYFMHIHI